MRGSGEQAALIQTAVEFVYYQGDTVFRPPDWEFRFTPVFNINYTELDEVLGLMPSPREGRQEPIITSWCKPFSSISTCVTFQLAMTLILCASVFSLSPAISADFVWTRPSGSACSGLATTIAISTLRLVPSHGEGHQ